MAISDDVILVSCKIPDTTWRLSILNGFISISPIGQVLGPLNWLRVDHRLNCDAEAYVTFLFEPEAYVTY